MTELAHASGTVSNLIPAKRAVDFSWRDVFVRIFPEKTTASAAFFMRTNVRSAEHIMEGRNGPGGRALINLLRSPYGPMVLNKILGDVDWREAELRALRIADLEQQIQEQKRRLEHLQRQVDE